MVGNLALWLLFLLVALLVATVALAVVLAVLLTPPFLGLISGILLRRDAKPRRRGFVVGVGLLNFSNFGLFIWPYLGLLQEWMASRVRPPDAPPAPVEDEVLWLVVFGVLLVANLGVGAYSLVVGLRKPGEPE